MPILSEVSPLDTLPLQGAAAHPEGPSGSACQILHGEHLPP